MNKIGITRFMSLVTQFLANCMDYHAACLGLTQYCVDVFCIPLKASESSWRPESESISWGCQDGYLYFILKKV